MTVAAVFASLQSSKYGSAGRCRRAGAPGPPPFGRSEVRVRAYAIAIRSMAGTPANWSKLNAVMREDTTTTLLSNR